LLWSRSTKTSTNGSSLAWLNPALGLYGDLRRGLQVARHLRDAALVCHRAIVADQVQAVQQAEVGVFEVDAAIEGELRVGEARIPLGAERDPGGAVLASRASLSQRTVVLSGRRAPPEALAWLARPL